MDKLKLFLGRLFEPGSTTNRAANLPFPFKVKVVEAPKSSILELRARGPEPVLAVDRVAALAEAGLEMEMAHR